MIKKVAIIALVIVASLSVAGCTVGLPITSSPTPTPTPTPVPTATPSPKATPSQPKGEEDDTSRQLTDLVKGEGLSVVTPFTKQINKNGNPVYSGTFTDGKYSYNGSIEKCKSSDDSLRSYDDQVAQYKNRGFPTYKESNNKWVGFNAKIKSSVEVKRITGSDQNPYLMIVTAK
jgi:hypothetical protein